jgi:hypothetical protein
MAQRRRRARRFDILCVYLEKDRPATLAQIAGAFDQGEASKTLPTCLPARYRNRFSAAG